MIKFIITYIIIILIFIYSQIFYFSLYLSGFFNNNIKETLKKYKNIIMNQMGVLHTYGYKNKLYKTGNYKSTNKVDIIIANHIGWSDFIVITMLLNIIDNKNIHYILEKCILNKLGGFSLLMYNADDIIINKSIEKDKLIIADTIKNIEKGFILIYPEGHIYKEPHINESLTFCKNNNLEPFNNLMYPKAKGLWTIIETLKKNNKLGNLIDLTLVFDNFKKNNKLVPDYLVSKLKSDEYNIGDIYYIINTYKLNKHIDNYDTFKDYLIKIWRKKDKILEGLNYKKLNYTEIKYNKIDIINCLLLNFNILFIFLFLAIKTKGIILPVMIIIIIYHCKLMIKYYDKYN